VIARLEHAVVLGAGTMGAQLACLLAGSGSAVQLLDLDGTTAAKGLERALGLRPGPVRRPEDLDRVTTGGFDMLASALHGAGWVIEAVVEQLDAKRDLLARLDAVLAGQPDWPIISSNTSGLSIQALVEGRSDRFRRSFLGTHFFNPPRYTRLLEIVPGTDTDVSIVAWVEEYGSRHLGKGTVRARDTPAFITSRLGVHEMLVALDLARRLGLGVDEVDELTGPLIGRPKSGTFRLLDLVGVDVSVAVADHCYAMLPDDPDRDRYRVPAILRALVERGALGEKRGAGMFKRVDGEILALDLESLEYRPRRSVVSGAVEKARGEPSLARRLAILLAGDDAASHFVHDFCAESLGYAAAVASVIADRAVTVDRAMRLGYGWQLGPFETWDAVGVDQTTELLRKVGTNVPELAERVIAGPGSFYRSGADGQLESLSFNDLTFSSISGGGRELNAPPARSVGGKLPSNDSASVRDLGGGILGVELHGELDVPDPDAIEMIGRAVELTIERGDGLVITTLASDFSTSANLAILLAEAEEGAWERLDLAISRFQAATRAIRYAPIPVVVAPRGRTLGGGAEICLAAARCQPLAETYVGLVDAGVGLIPAGGGSTEMARRAAARVDGVSIDGVSVSGFTFYCAALETLAFSRVSTSAYEARVMGLLGPADLVTADPERQLADAVSVVRTLAEVGYQPPAERPIRVVGRRGLEAVEAMTDNQLGGRHLSGHDRTVVLELTRVMSGGDVAEGTELPEASLLELEREAFLRLLGNELTRDRMRHTLKTGKMLLN
jgi:3-hydroxyacyl-CoA dehydrogenase